MFRSNTGSIAERLIMVRIFKHYISIPHLIVCLMDFSIFLLSSLVVRVLGRFYSDPTISPRLSELLPKGLLLALVGVAVFFQAGLYDSHHMKNSKGLILRIISAYSVIVLVSVSAVFIIPRLAEDRFAFMLMLLLSFFATMGWRLFVASRIHNFSFWKERVVVIGTSQLSKIFEEFSLFHHNLEISSVISPQSLARIDLHKFTLEKKAHTIVISLKERRGALPLNAILKCKMNGINVMEWGHFYEKNMNKIDIMEINPSHLIFSDGFERKGLTQFFKNIFDFFLASVGLILTIPVSLITALLIKLESPGPIFYLQERVGAGGQTFKIIKFRSMVSDAEKEKIPQWASKNDSRVTRVGNFLRKTRIDEIPQLINILKGEMSFVGPRPERPYFVDQLEKEIPFYIQRHVVKPGLTGWAQIRYRYGSSIDDALRKLEFDFYYIKNMSLFLDMMIILETVQVVLFQKGSR